MNKNKISFIICTNSESALRECELYIHQLRVPADMTVNILPVRGAASMAEGYNTGMLQSDAKYKVYLHQDVLILYENFLADTLEIFRQNPTIGMLGMVGTKQLHPNGCMWSNPMRTGALRMHTLNTTDDFFDIPMSGKQPFTLVEAIDGLLMMTQEDLLWRSDLFPGWDFYDISQSQEFRLAGYRVAVPYQETPWVLHDCGFLDLTQYHTHRRTFLEEYCPENQTEINACARFLAEKDGAGPDPRTGAEEAVALLLSQIAAGKYTDAVRYTQEHLSEYQDNETFCILTILLQIYQHEEAEGIHEIFVPLEQEKLPADWLLIHYQWICRYIWRTENGLPDVCRQEGADYFKKWHVSQIAVERIRPFCIPE